MIILSPSEEWGISLRLDLKGIRFHIWLYFALFALGILALFGVLQNVLIEPYYRDNKITAKAIADKAGTFLVDNITSLMQNALFPPETGYEMDIQSAQRCTEELVTFAQNVRHAVFVSDYIYSDAERYTESTQAYRKCLADADRKLVKCCDVVIEVTAGIPIIHKGELNV